MPALLVLEHCPQEQLQGIVGSGAFPDKGHVAAQEHEIRRLTEELRKVTMERDILRKATAYFAQLSK